MLLCTRPINKHKFEKRFGVKYSTSLLYLTNFLIRWNLIIFRNMYHFFSLKRTFKCQKSLFCKASFLQNKNWLYGENFVYNTSRLVRMFLLLGAINKEFCFFFSGKLFYKSNRHFFLLCMLSLILTLEGLGEFPIVIQNCLEFSQHPLVFISGYANRENVSYYLIFIPTTIRETTPTWGMVIIKLNRNKSNTRIVVIGPNHWPKTWRFIDVGAGSVYGSDVARNTTVISYHKLLFNKQMSVICKSSFLNYIWRSAETLLLPLDLIIVVHYYMSSGFKLFHTYYSERENWIWPHDKTKLKWTLIFLLKNLFCLVSISGFSSNWDAYIDFPHSSVICSSVCCLWAG